MRKKIILACEVCHQRNYSTSKNAANQSERLEARKFCGRCNEHTIHRETK